MKKIKIKGVINFRELGGIVNQDGKTVKHGYFYRSGSLGGMNEKNQSRFDKLRIKEIFDYRHEDEVALEADYVGNAEYHHISAVNDLKDSPVIPAQVKKFVLNATEEVAKDTKRKFVEGYVEMPFDNPAYIATMNALKSHHPILFHCTAGKDRTGVGAAIILKALNVSDEEIIKDFLLSNKYRSWYNRSHKLMLKVFKRNKWSRYLFREIAICQEANIVKTLKAISDKYPNFDDYLINECKVTKEDIADWREFYLV